MTDGLKDKYRKAIIDILSTNERVERVALFGSRAMGTFTVTSDVDIALFGDKLTLSDQADLATVIKELSIPQQVDILLYKSIKSKKLLEHIKRHGVEWWRRDGGVGSEWKTIPAAEFCASVRDGTHDSPKQVVEGPYLVTSRHITSNRIELQNAYKISQEDFDAINKRSKVDRWDVLITMIGTVGEPCLVEIEPEFAIKNIGLFKSKSELEGKWLYYYLLAPDVQQLIRTYSRGSTQQYIPLGALREFPVTFPTDSGEMKAIAHILGSLDDKIELNRQMNQTLEKMAQAIFKSWFIDFDPVRAKAEGRDTGLPKKIADLFPDRFEPACRDARGAGRDSELGEVPKGWEVKPIGDVVELAYGKSLPKKKRVFGKFPVYGSGGVTGFHSKYVVQGPGIIVGRKGTVGSVYWEERNFFPIDTVFYVSIKTVMPLYWVFLRLSLMDIQKLGADSAVPGVNRNSVYAQKWIVPTDTIMEYFQAISNGFLGQTEENRRQINSLSKLRDTLLPKLISGELPVPDVEKILEGVE